VRQEVGEVDSFFQRRAEGAYPTSINKPAPPTAMAVYCLTRAHADI
jgi:hypothetical protein